MHQLHSLTLCHNKNHHVVCQRTWMFSEAPEARRTRDLAREDQRDSSIVEHCVAPRTAQSWKVFLVEPSWLVEPPLFKIRLDLDLKLTARCFSVLFNQPLCIDANSSYWFNSFKIHTYIHTYRHTYIHTYIRTYIHTDRHADIQTYRPTDLQTYRPTDLQTYRRTDGQTDRHTYIHVCTYIYIYMFLFIYIHIHILYLCMCIYLIMYIFIYIHDSPCICVYI